MRVAYVAMVVHVCCKLLFLMFHLFFQRYVASVFIWILNMFHTYVASVLSGCCICFSMAFQVFSGVFASVSDTCFKCFICLQTYVANASSGYFKIDRVLLLGPTPTCCSRRSGEEVEGRERSSCGVRRRGRRSDGHEPPRGRAKRSCRRGGLGASTADN